jgi:hypothetical protein
MKFQSLIAAILLFAFDNGASLLGVDAIAAPHAAGTQPEMAPLPEPLSVGLLGAGIALLGWTRRQGSWGENLKRKLGQLNVLPWPGLCWLD